MSIIFIHGYITLFIYCEEVKAATCFVVSFKDVTALKSTIDVNFSTMISISDYVFVKFDEKKTILYQEG